MIDTLPIGNIFPMHIHLHKEDALENFAYIHLPGAITWFRFWDELINLISDFISQIADEWFLIPLSSVSNEYRLSKRS